MNLTYEILPDSKHLPQIMEVVGEALRSGHSVEMEPCLSSTGHHMERITIREGAEA